MKKLILWAVFITMEDFTFIIFKYLLENRIGLTGKYASVSRKTREYFYIWRETIAQSLSNPTITYCKTKVRVPTMRKVIVDTMKRTESILPNGVKHGPSVEKIVIRKIIRDRDDEDQLIVYNSEKMISVTNYSFGAQHGSCVGTITKPNGKRYVSRTNYRHDKVMPHLCQIWSRNHGHRSHRIIYRVNITDLRNRNKPVKLIINMKKIGEIPTVTLSGYDNDQPDVFSTPLAINIDNYTSECIERIENDVTKWWLPSEHLVYDFDNI